MAKESRNSIHPCQELLATMRIENLYPHDMAGKPANREAPAAIFVREAREKMRLGGEDFGKLFGCTRGNISGWENGRHSPSYEQLVAISQKSGIPLPGVIEAPNDERTAELRALWEYVPSSMQERMLAEMREAKKDFLGVAERPKVISEGKQRPMQSKKKRSPAIEG